MLVLVVQLNVMGLAQSFLIVIVNTEYYIIVFIIHDSVFQTWIVSAELNSNCFFAVHGEFDWRICHSLTVCSQLRYESSTWIRNLKLVLGTWIFNWEPTYLLIWSKQVLLQLLYYQSFIILSCNTINVIIKYTNDIYLISTLHYTTALRYITL